MTLTSIKELTQKKGLMYASIVKKTSLPPLDARVITYTQENNFVCKHLRNYLVILVILSGTKDLLLVRNLSNVSTVGKSLPLPVSVTLTQGFTLEGSPIHVCIYVLYKWFHHFLLP